MSSATAHTVTQAEVDGVRLLASLAFDGFGAAIVPATAVPTWLEGSFQRITVPELPRRVVAFARRRRPSATAPTMAAQSLEHLLLALCYSEAVHIPRSEQHQLDLICRRLPDENPYKTECRNVSWLEGYSTSYRYPKTKGWLPDEPEDEDLNDAIVAIGRTLSTVAMHFGVDVASTTQVAAKRIDPPRL